MKNSAKRRKMSFKETFCVYFFNFSSQSKYLFIAFWMKFPGILRCIKYHKVFQIHFFNTCTHTDVKYVVVCAFSFNIFIATSVVFNMKLWLRLKNNSNDESTESETDSKEIVSSRLSDARVYFVLFTISQSSSHAPSSESMLSVDFIAVVHGMGRAKWACGHYYCQCANTCSCVFVLHCTS